MKNKELPEDEILYRVRLPEVIFGEENLFLATADGNGMTDFGIDDGDELLFSAGREPKPGDVVVAGVPGFGKMVRQYLKTEDGKYCLHASGEEPREDVIADEADFYGVLAWIIKKFRAPSEDA